MTVKDGNQHIVVAGAGYAGMQVALRFGGWLSRHLDFTFTLIDPNDYHQVLTELPRVATGTRTQSEVEVPLERVLSPRITFLQTSITGFDLAHRQLHVQSGQVPFDWLVLALGSRPNDFHIPGLAENVRYMWSAEDAQAVWDAVNDSVRRAAQSHDPAEQRRLLTIVIGGGGATGVELAGAFAEELPQLARQHGAPADLVKVVLVEGGHTILAGSSPALVARATQILHDLHVDVRTNAMIVAATRQGLQLKSNEVIEGGVYIWAGGVKAPDVVKGSCLPVGYNGRVKVNEYLQVDGFPEIFAAGDLASVVDPETGRALNPLAQIAIDEGMTVAYNLRAAIEGRPMRPFRFHNKGFVVSVGGRKGVADVAGLTIGGRLAHTLKDAIEWEYRQSVHHLGGRLAL